MAYFILILSLNCLCNSFAIEPSQSKTNKVLREDCEISIQNEFLPWQIVSSLDCPVTNQVGCYEDTAEQHLWLSRALLYYCLLIVFTMYKYYRRDVCFIKWWPVAYCILFRGSPSSCLVGNIEFNKALAIISLTGIINRTILHKSSYQLLSCLFFSEGCLRV